MKNPRSLVVAGIMSGTSADGIDVALTRIRCTRGHAQVELLAHEGFAYPAALRRAVLAAMNAARTSTPELAQLNWRLGIAYADAVQIACAKHKIGIDLVGCHGQTLYHQPRAARYAGRSMRCTWQLGEPAVLASMLGKPVVSNFRPADMLAGGQGAPLVPLLDYTLFAHASRARVLQNIGGISNLTAIAAHADPSQIIAFDNGPGNMVLDALAAQLLGKPFDRNGNTAARGTVLPEVLAEALRHPFFRQKPPRTAGREQFGADYARQFLKLCRRHSRRPEDALATATALTVQSIVQSYQRYVHLALAASVRRPNAIDYIVSGGGARNRTMMRMLADELSPLGCVLSTSTEHGLPEAAKEATAFALLAWNTWHFLPGNLPAATGATRPALLGQVCYA